MSAEQFDLWPLSESLAPSLALPPLPSLVRYYDQFAGEERVLRDVATLDWQIHHSGSIVRVNCKQGAVVSDQVIARVIIHYISNS